jgi:probable phosphoglycerate mutase
MGNQADRPAGGLRPGRLILVKHGQPQIAPDVPRSGWALSSEGREASTRLAAKLAGFEPQALFASTETKAHDTALAIGEVLGLPVRGDDDLREHRADENPFVSPTEIADLIERALRDPDHLVMGEETGVSARARFARAIGRVEAAGGGIVVAHGRIITFWLSARLGVDPVPLWRKLGFASAVVLSQDGCEIITA